MNPILRELIETGRAVSAAGRAVEIHSGISPAEGAVLQELVRAVKPTKSLEVGLAYGMSALYICDALELTADTRHTIIDPNQHDGPWGHAWDDIGLYNLKRAGYEEIIEFLALPSHTALPGLESEHRTIDFAFVDGWHTFDFTLVDFFYIDRMLRVGGIVVFDDANWPSVRKVCRYIVTNRAYSVVPTAAGPPTSWRRRLLGGVLGYLPRALLKPEVVESDAMLGLHGSMIAFRKDADDRRSFSFHRPF